MKRLIIQTQIFSDDLDALIAENRLLISDYEDLERSLCKDPDQGDLIQGTGGLRKVRLKSSSKGKRGGFRVCYCDIPEKKKLFLILIYGKNEKEDVSQEDKKIVKKLMSLSAMWCKKSAGSFERFSRLCSCKYF